MADKQSSENTKIAKKGYWGKNLYSGAFVIADYEFKVES